MFSNPFPLDFFADLWLGMSKAGYSVMHFFANFGTYFTEPFLETFVRIQTPGLYTFLKPIIIALEKALSPILGHEFVDFLLGPSLLEMLGIGVVLSVFSLLWKKIWEILPFV